MQPAHYLALRLAREALRRGGGGTTLFNAANEMAVAGFLAEQIGFLDIEKVVEETLDALAPPAPASVEAVLAIDAEARRWAQQRIERITAGG